MTIRSFFAKGIAALVVIFGALFLVASLLYSLLLGNEASNFLRLPGTPLIVAPQEPPSEEQYGKLLELHGTLRSEDELQIPEYGIHLPATCLLVKAREVRPEPEGNIVILAPLPPEKRTQLNCPDRRLWAEHLHCGHYPIDPDFIPTLLSDRGYAGYTCMRSILPLPLEHIHLPEHLQRMARVLPETERLDNPDCTIIHLAERYRDPAVPTGPAQPGDIELRFSYLPAEFPVSLRGRMGVLYLTCHSATYCAFAAGNRQLPPVKTSFTGQLISGAMFLAAVAFIFVLLLLALGLLLFGLCCLCGRYFPVPLRWRLIVVLVLQSTTMLVGYLLS